MTKNTDDKCKQNEHVLFEGAKKCECGEFTSEEINENDEPDDKCSGEEHVLFEGQKRCECGEFTSEEINENDEPDDLYRKLHKEGLLVSEPTELWTPLETRDSKWKNYFIGQNNTPMHLLGNWMINTETHELAQIDKEELDFSTKSFGSYIAYLGDREN